MGIAEHGTLPGPARLAGERLAARVVRRVRDVVEARGGPRPPFPPERYAARCGVAAIRRGPVPDGTARAEPQEAAPGEAGRRWVLTLDPRLPPHTPQWNGAFALALARTLLPAGVAGPAADALAEVAAAELLLPMHAFRPAAARTDLTMDGVRDLAMRFAAPVRLTVRQWLRAGTWRGLALLWREENGVLRLRWRAASRGAGLPPAAALGAPADALWRDPTRLYATYRTGRPHHGVEEVRAGAGPAWWFTRFGVVRDEAAGSSPPRGGRAVLALVTLARGG